jgi:ATP-dependent DNA helicase RecG
MRLESCVDILPGVGNVKKKNFAELGIVTLRDLLWHFPRTYQNRGNIQIVSLGACGVTASFVLTVGTEPKCVNIRRGMSLLKFRAFDEGGTVEITYFNQNYLKDSFQVGKTYRFFGKLEREKSQYKMSSPAHEAWSEERPLPSYYPIYRLSGSLSQNFMQSCIKTALAICVSELEDYLPQRVRRQVGLCTLLRAVEDIHNPGNAESITLAAKRLAFDEIFRFTLGVSALSAKRQREGGRVFERCNMQRFYDKIGFSLTKAQSKCIDEILGDMCPAKGSAPMSRIVIGDVGSGKTVCAAAAVYIALENSVQAAIMAPTEILAAQHYNDLQPLFESLGYNTVLLTGSMSRSEKKRVHDAISGRSGRADLVIGTHALISQKAEFENLGLVVADEQHRFGVAQRAALAKKGECPHLLVMSATPIPRSLALVMYGELDVSIIDELPPGRQKVETFVVNESYRQRLNNFILKLTGEGGQVYIVCPTVEHTEDGEIDIAEIANESEPLKAAVDMANELSQGALSSLSVAYLHGRMKPSEKDEIMRRFIRGDIQVLVSTTVIEVGVNVPNACLMIVENAERFGLSQLHQLRGRVGRGNRKSYCILVSGGQGEATSRRLDAMKTLYDGYKIAEEDLKIRGPGDFLPSNDENSMRQHGDVKFRFATVSSDSELFKSAVEYAREVAAKDPKLQREENKVLGRYLALSEGQSELLN